MKKRVYRRSHSQIINNFYTLVTIVIMTAIITLYSKYIYNDKAQEQTIYLQCLNELNIEQKVGDKKLFIKGWQLFSQGNYVVDGGLITEENFTLPADFSLEKTNELFENSIDVVAIKNAQKYLKIKYEIMQTKNKKPLELGFLVSFRVNAKEIIRFITSLNSTNSEKFSTKIACIMESFKANAKQ